MSVPITGVERLAYSPAEVAARSVGRVEHVQNLSPAGSCAASSSAAAGSSPATS